MIWIMQRHFSKSWKRESDLKVSSCILYTAIHKKQRLFPRSLCKGLYKNIMEAQVCDGYGYTLQITYKDGRKRVIEGDIGGGTIDGIMGNYLKKIFGRNYDD